MEAVFILYTGTSHDYNEFDAKRFMFASPEMLLVANSFKDCKKHVKTLLGNKNSFDQYEEVLFDGSVDNNSLIFKSKNLDEENFDKVFWVSYTPINNLLSKFVPKEKKNLFALYVAPLDKSYKVLIGVTDSFINLQKLVEESSGLKISVKFNAKLDKENILLTTEQAIYYCQSLQN